MHAIELTLVRPLEMYVEGVLRRFESFAPSSSSGAGACSNRMQMCHVTGLSPTAGKLVLSTK